MPSDPILAAFDRRLRRAAERPMVVSSHRRASAGDVDRMARAAGTVLAAGGVAPGALIGLSALNGPGFLAALLAVRRAGHAAALLDAFSPRQEALRSARALGVVALFTCATAWPQEAGDFALRAIEVETAQRLPPEIAVVKLTSGSTGLPRGIVTPSAALVADDAALAATMGLADDERILAAIPMSHSYGLSSVVMPALMRRAVLVLPSAGNPLDPMVVARRRGVTFLPTVPAYLQALLKMSTPPAAPDTLRLVVTAGAPLLPAAAARFRARYQRPVHVFYGASECGGITFDRQGSAGERGSLGTPVDGVRVTLEPLPGAAAGSPPTVTVASPAVACGYLPEADPCLAGGRFHSRDLGTLRDGELYLQGRLDELINVRGKKVDPREIEAVLRRLDGVEDAVTLGVALPGRDEQVIRSFVACPGGGVGTEAVLAWCRHHLAGHKVPRSIVLLEAIPRTSRGKLDRAALLALGPDHG